MKDLKNNQDNVVSIIWQGDGANASPNYAARDNFYNVSSLPHTQFGGYETQTGGGTDMYPYYLSKYNIVIDDVSPLSINLYTGIVTRDNLEIQADIEVTENVTTTNNRIIFIVTRRINSDYFCSVEYYDDESFDLTTIGQTGSYTRSIPMDANWTESNIKVIAMVQTWNNDPGTNEHRILQAEMCLPNNALPGIVVDVTELSSTLDPDEIDDTQSFEITNDGDPLSNLTYDISWVYTTTFRENSSLPKNNTEVDRGVPHPVYSQVFKFEQWLDIVPINGECSYDETDVIDVEFNSAGLPAGIYTAVITIGNNAGADETIDVTMTINPGRNYPVAITFNSWIIGREAEILTESSFGCGYWADDGWLWVECGNFPTDWTNGDVLHIEVVEPSTGHTGSVEITLNWEAYQYSDDILLTPVVVQPDPPTNLTITEDGTNVTLNWDAVTGATSYTIYSDTDPYGDFLYEEDSGITSTTWNELLSGAGDMKYYQVTASN